MSFKFEDTMQIEIKDAIDAFVIGAQFVDPVGLAEDLKVLTDTGWRIGVVASGSIGLGKDSLTIVVTPAANKFRVVWALSIHAEGGVKIGYSEVVKRPGDFDGTVLTHVVSDALKAGEAEVKQWSNALALARAAIA